MFQIIDFNPQQYNDDEKEKICSFCKTPKSKAKNNFLVEGLEASMCIDCHEKIKQLLNDNEVA